MGPVFAHRMLMFGSLLPRITRAVRRLDHAVGRARSRPQVLVESRTPMNLAVLAPVWRGLLDDGRFGVWFTGPGRDDLSRAFRDAGVEASVVRRSACRLRRWDLYLNADPWDPVTLWRCRHRINFFHGVAGKYNLECPTDLPLDFGRYDRVAFPNEGRLRRYVEAGLVPAERAALVGFPKLDRLVNATASPREVSARIGLPADRPTAIYAPTFSPESSLQRHGERIAAGLLNEGFNVIIKLHDRSFDPDPRYSGGVDWRERFAPLTAAGHCLLATGGDSSDYLLASDLMVTDHSTIGFEFCALDRPLVVFDAPELIEAARIDPAKVRLLRAAADLVTDSATVGSVARAALAGAPLRAAARAHAVREVFHDPGRATERALALCCELLDCPARPVGATVGAVTG
jgi:hypothetical protein